MTGKVLLDTNIVVALFKDDPAVHQRLEQYPRVLVSAVVLGELYFGAQNSARLDKHLRQINRFLTRVAVLESNAETASNVLLLAFLKLALSEIIPQRSAMQVILS